MVRHCKVVARPCLPKWLGLAGATIVCVDGGVLVAMPMLGVIMQIFGRLPVSSKTPQVCVLG